jgi:ubiquinone/menaquinone biosynthesis C-methylase UbiE
MTINLLSHWCNKGYNLNFGEDCILRFIRKERNRTISKVLDLGCGSGRDLMLIRNELTSTDMELYGIGSTSIEGVQIYNLDLECERLPFLDNNFDLTLCNQVLEHLKNWMWAFHEQIRVTQMGGLAIVGFPNLAALHCRIQLMFGKHPSCIKID